MVGIESHIILRILTEILIRLCFQLSPFFLVRSSSLITCVLFAAVKIYKKQALIQSHLRTFWSSQNLPDWNFVCPYISSTLVKPAAKENGNLINLEAICEKLVFNQLCVSPDDTGANWLTWRNEGWAQINQKCWWSAQTKKPASKLNTLTKCWNIKGWSLLLCLISSAAQTQQLITSVFKESDVWV